jgi:hypothetical protein
MAGPTVLDLPVGTNLLNTDKIYIVRGVSPGRDKQMEVREIYFPNIVIKNQTELEYYFGDGTETGTGQTEGGWDYSESGGNVTVTIPNNIFVFIKSNPSDGVTTHFKYDATNFPINAYTLKTKVNLSTGIRIEGDGIDQTIMIKANNFVDFITNYVDQTTVSSVTSNDFTVSDSSEFQPGMTIEHSQDNNFYKVVDVPDGTSVLVDKPITGTGSGNLSICQDNIQLKNFTFDGRGDVDNLGGVASTRAFDLSYCAHSNFEAKVINCKITSGDGAAYDCNSLVFNLKIKNIYHSFASNSRNGGAIANCDYSIITDIFNCSAELNGGACYQCDKSVIQNIKDCKVIISTSPGTISGGACSNCNESIISDIYNCYVESDSNIMAGGACANCNNSTIMNIYNCYCNTTFTGDALGGACYQCNESKISNIHDCRTLSPNSKGGACYQCNNSNISNINDCSSTGSTLTEGGACAECDESIISEIHNCSIDGTTGTAQGGAVANCDNSVIHGIYDCSASNNGNTAIGGAAYGCLFTKIHSINNCSADTGGIADSCTECDIGNANNSSPNGATGAGINNCDQTTFNGNFNNSSDIGPPPRLIRNSVNCAWSIVHDGTPRQATGTPGF